MSNLAHAENVLTLISSPDRTVYDAITSFLDSVGVESQNTRLTYEMAIKEFFRNTRNKEIENLSSKDLEYSVLEIEKYRNNMIGNFKNATINIKMIAIKRLFDKLARYDIVKTSTPFEMKKLKEYDTNSYDPMTIDEVRKSIEVVSSSKNGKEKALLIELAFVTGFRKHALLNVKFNDFKSVNGMYIVKVLDKGNKWSTKKIEPRLYNDVMEHKKSVDRENVFKMSNTTVQRMMNLINKEIDFGDRYITFHSFKKASIEEVAIQTNFDIKAMQAQGNHADASTTLNVYMKNKNIEDMPTVSLNDSEPDLSAIKDLTKDNLFDIIGKLDRKTQIQIIELAKNK